jgi:hypothetical protein
VRMAVVRRPCLVRGCVRFAVRPLSRCWEHEQEKGRENYLNVSSGTTSAWKKQRDRVLKRDGNRCRRCGVAEKKINGRSNLQAHHVDGSKPGTGGSIRTPTSDDRLLTLCTKCHGIATKKMRDAKLASSPVTRRFKR